MAITCSEYDETISAASRRNVTNFTCVFKHEFEVTGTNASTDKPEAWSNPNHKCGAYARNDVSKDYALLPYPLILSICVGHKLTTGDLRGVEFEAIRAGKLVQTDAFNNLVEILKNLVNLRLESKKYSTVYGNNKPSDNLLTVTPNTHAKKAVLDKLLTCIKKLLPNTTVAANTYDPTYDQRPTQTVTLDSNKPLLSKNNMNAIINAIKKDLNDCICYGDCNGYSVCFCYGNCNHY